MTMSPGWSRAKPRTSKPQATLETVAGAKAAIMSGVGRCESDESVEYERMSERIPAIKVLLLPKDTNALGTIFGGVILSHIDLASAVEARKTAPVRYVTKAMREVEFHAPVFLVDLVKFSTETTRVGRTSITVKVV